MSKLMTRSVPALMTVSLVAGYSSQHMQTLAKNRGAEVRVTK